MLSDLFDNVMDMFGGRKSRARGDSRGGQFSSRDMFDSLLDGDDPRQDRHRQRHRDDDRDDDQSVDPERRSRHGDRRSSFPDFD